MDDLVGSADSGAQRLVATILLLHASTALAVSVFAARRRNSCGRGAITRIDLEGGRSRGKPHRRRPGRGDADSRCGRCVRRHARTSGWKPALSGGVPGIRFKRR
ncbi:hypothetical protein G6F40_017114 [Rhizopus arrhizus]|nr:hypothetical protein G6F40_017114 [Rhizopus arrhizus]